MPIFDKLCNARSDTELFVLLCDLTHTPTYRLLRAEIASVRQKNGLTLELTIRQGTQQRVAPKEVQLLWVITHVFTLPANGPLVWQMKGQPALTGLEAIRARLDRLRASLDQLLLADQQQSEHA